MRRRWAISLLINLPSIRQASIIISRKRRSQMLVGRRDDINGIYVVPTIHWRLESIVAAPRRVTRVLLRAEI